MLLAIRGGGGFMRRLLGALIAAAVMTAACGGKSTPTSPTEGTGVPVSPGSTGATATITGSVQGASASALLGASSGAALTGVTVTVAGTAVSSSVDAGGRFTLTNVPPGDVQLQLTGGGANAAVALPAVRAAQTVDIVVMVAGASASIDSEVRSGAGESELEGRIESLPPTMPALSFKAAGRAVRTDGGTRFLDGSITRAFADLQIGMRVHVKGTLAGDTLTASQVELQNANIVAVEVNGIIDSVAGTAATFQFRIGSRVIKGDVLTAFFGDGDKPDSFASLKDGARVEVKGQQRDGFIYATRIHVNGPDTTPTTDPGQDTSASIQGVLTAMSGARPALVLAVGTTTVRTTSSTEVKRRGDVQTLDALKIGQTLHVVGDRQADGSIVARKIEIDDDAAGGEFEIEGAVGGLKGTCPAVQFGVNGFAVATSASTAFEGGGCSALKSGDKVTVKGTRQSDGSVAATRVSRK
jgi:cytoskeletal protein CcmA (bactofilin family)